MRSACAHRLLPQLRTSRISFIAALTLACCTSASGSGEADNGSGPEEEVGGSDATGDLSEGTGADATDGADDETDGADAGDNQAGEAGELDSDGPDANAEEAGPADAGADVAVGEDTPPEDTAPVDAATDVTPAETGPTDVSPVDAGGGPDVIRFIVMGDTGEANEEQYRVSASAQTVCDAVGGCVGFIMLGDNIYDTGAHSPDDPEFEAKINLPYQNLRAGAPPAPGAPDTRPRMPIFVSLGNHDLGGAGLETALIENYLGYARTHDWFYYPAEFWEHQVGFVHLMALHTNPLAYLGTTQAEQGGMVDDVVDTTDAVWTIAFGHHPYRSNGRHGNAGAYEGIPGPLIFNGSLFKPWVEEHVCNRVDFFFSGHDHNRQWLASVPNIGTDVWGEGGSPCNTRFAVSGAGAKTDDPEDRDNDTAFEVHTEGFLLAHFHREYVEMEYYDQYGAREWNQTFVR